MGCRLGCGARLPACLDKEYASKRRSREDARRDLARAMPHLFLTCVIIEGSGSNGRLLMQHGVRRRLCCGMELSREFGCSKMSLRMPIEEASSRGVDVETTSNRQAHPSPFRLHGSPIRPRSTCSRRAATAIQHGGRLRALRALRALRRLDQSAFGTSDEAVSSSKLTMEAVALSKGYPYPGGVCICLTHGLQATFGRSEGCGGAAAVSSKSSGPEQ